MAAPPTPCAYQDFARGRPTNPMRMPVHPSAGRYCSARKHDRAKRLVNWPPTMRAARDPARRFASRQTAPCQVQQETHDDHQCHYSQNSFPLAGDDGMPQVIGTIERVPWRAGLDVIQFPIGTVIAGFIAPHAAASHGRYHAPTQDREREWHEARSFCRWYPVPATREPRDGHAALRTSDASPKSGASRFLEEHPSAAHLAYQGPSLAKLRHAREAAWRHAAGLATLTQPVAQIGLDPDPLTQTPAQPFR